MILILLLSYQYVVERLNLEQSKVAKVSLDTYGMCNIPYVPYYFIFDRFE